MTSFFDLRMVECKGYIVIIFEFEKSNDNFRYSGYDDIIASYIDEFTSRRNSLRTFISNLYLRGRMEMLTFEESRSFNDMSFDRTINFT
jgi:hypothetical protein